MLDWELEALTAQPFLGSCLRRSIRVFEFLGHLSQVIVAIMTSSCSSTTKLCASIEVPAQEGPTLHLLFLDLAISD